MFFFLFGIVIYCLFFFFCLLFFCWVTFQGSPADLYDEIAMPYDLRQAHRANDAAVMRAYGFEVSLSESECVKRLLERYKKLTGQD
ncbi:MAG: hypothetical protein Q4F00_14270 [bacterium]|nr:hypothetical protein [bacterium]